MPTLPGLARGRTRRRIARAEGRVHVEVRGIHRPDADDLRKAVEAALLSHPAVEAVETLAVLGRVAVVFDPDAATPEDLVAIVAAVEDEQGVAREVFPADRAEHPGDMEPYRRDLLAIGADGAAVVAAVAGRFARLVRLPTEVAGLVAFAQSQARVRHALESVVGPGPADVVLAVSGAAAQAFAQGPLGLVVDGAHRAVLLAESRARLDAWGRRERDLTRERPPPEVHDWPTRPVPVPAGPVEQYERRALAAAGAAFVGVGVATRNVRRAAAATMVTTPKAAGVGRDVFAAHLGRTLAGRDTVVLDRRALRRLDRVDTVVVDAPALRRSEPDIERVVPIGGFDVAVVAARVRSLFRPDRPHLTRRRGDARLERLADHEDRIDVRRARRQLGDRPELLLLSVDEEPAALVAIGRPVAPETQQLATAARAAGHMLVVAGDEALCRRVGADLFVPGGDHLVASIHMLQRDGAVPLLISRRSAALAAADVGVAVVGTADRIPWGADLLVAGWEDACLLVEASAVAHEVSRQSAALALAGSSIGALSLLGGLPATAAARAMTAVNGAALAAVANGARAGVALARHPPVVARPVTAWHELDPDDALTLAGGRRDGLTGDEVAGRVPASVARRGGPSFVRALVDELANPLTPVLAGAGILAASIGSFTDAALVAGVTAVNGTLGAVQRVQVERAVRALEHESRQRVRVRRDGGITTVGAAHLVVGDVVLLDAGSQVPADCRILACSALEVDESALTGESLPVAKSTEPVIAASPADRTSMLYAGTAVAAGSVEAVVVAVGADTEAGAAATGESTSTGGVEARLRDLTRISIPVSVVGGATVTLAGLLRGAPLPIAAQTGVSLAVAAVPEGLPALATVAQLSAAHRLSRRGALVRNPRSVEALGRVDVLCTDKTGTMTEGHIELALVSDGQTAVPVSAAAEQHTAIVAAAVAASPREDPGRPLRHLTDRAVLDAAPSWGVPVNHSRRVQDLPFEPARGYHAAIERDDAGMTLYVKGAPDKLLGRCVAWRRAGGPVPIGHRERRILARHVESLGARGYRVLAAAQRATNGAHDLADGRIRNLELVGFLALADPVRPTAAAATAALRRAGVRIVMVTGDHPATAQGIAEDLGIFEAGRVVTGPELDALDDTALDAQLAGVTVFARITPAQKVRIVQAYQREGRVVAMAGDGANDAAAIRLADVGIALGDATSATRTSADLLVPGGRVETIIDAIIEGRAMWSSVRDAVALLLGGNLGEVAFTVTAAVLTGRSPLSARQLLLVNLLTDTLPALAIALRPPKAASWDALLREGPEASLGGSLERAIWARGAATAGAAAAAWAGARLTAQGPQTATVTLVGLVTAQLGQTLAAGFRDPRVLAASLGSAAAMVAIVQTPGISQLFGCQPLSPFGWAIGLGAGAAGTTAAAIAKPLLEPRAEVEPDRAGAPPAASSVDSQ